MNDELTQHILEQSAAGVALDVLVQRYPQHGDEIRALLGVVHTLQGANHPAPLPRAAAAQQDFLRLAAQRRMAQQTARADTSKLIPTRAPQIPSRSRQRSWLAAPSRLAWAVTLLLVLFFGGGGIVAASANTVPGDALYGVKRWRERVEFRLSSNDGKADEYLEQAAERAREVEILLQRGEPVPLALITDLRSVTVLSESRLTALGADDQRWAELVTLTTNQQTLLASIQPTDDPTREALMAAQIQANTTQTKAINNVRQAPVLHTPKNQSPLPSVLITTPTKAVPPGQTKKTPTVTPESWVPVAPVASPTAEPIKPGNPNPGPPAKTDKPGNPNPGPPAKTDKPGNPNPGPPAKTDKPGNPDPGPPAKTDKPGNPNPGPPAKTDKPKPDNPNPDPPVDPGPPPKTDKPKEAPPKNSEAPPVIPTTVPPTDSPQPTRVPTTVAVPPAATSAPVPPTPPVPVPSGPPSDDGDGDNQHPGPPNGQPGPPVPPSPPEPTKKPK